jgi:hypothetical protein
MTDATVTDLPVNITLDLDAYERPAKDVKEPFAVKLGGRVVVFEDPEELDWQDLLDIDHPAEFLNYSVSVEDRRHIVDLKMPSHKFAKLMESYQTHFGIEDKVREAKRRQARGF